MIKKACYLSYDFGFLSIHSREIIENMVESGVKTELIIPSDADFLFKLTSKCIIHRVPVLFKKAIIKSLIYQITLSLTLIFKIIKEKEVDLIYARQNYLSILPVVISRIFKIPYFAEVNGIVTGRARTGYAESIKFFVKSMMEKHCLYLSNILIVPSETLKYRICDLLKISSKKIYTVPNGVNTKIFNSEKSKKNIRKNLNIKNKDFLVGYVGSLGGGQGIETLKATIKKIVRNEDKIKFLIVGDYIPDADISKLKAGHAGEGAKFVQYIINNKLSERVIYHPYVLYEESADYIKICDTLVAPYSNSQIQFGGGSPMKLYAYLGCAKPVIMSDLGEFTDSEICRKNNAVYFIPPDDSQALSGAILKLKNSEKLRKSLSRNGIKFVKKHRKWSDSCNKILSIYKRQFMCSNFSLSKN
jgi:glycosyltransferase involved in cell wall biosynthesis